MCFTCSAQECENNQANPHYSSLPATRLEVKDLSLTQFIPSVSVNKLPPTPLLHTSTQFYPPAPPRLFSHPNP